MVLNFFLGTSPLKNFMWKLVMTEQMMYLSLTACPQKLRSQVRHGQGYKRPERRYISVGVAVKLTRSVLVCGSLSALEKI